MAAIIPTLGTEVNKKSSENQEKPDETGRRIDRRPPTTVENLEPNRARRRPMSRRWGTYGRGLRVMVCDRRPCHATGMSTSCAGLMMRFLTYVVVIAALSSPFASASAQAVDPALCSAESSTSDQRIAACSAAIASGGTAQDIASAQAERAWAYHDKGQRDRAMSDVNEALRLDPNSAKAFRIRGEIHRRAGRLDAALADFNQAIRIDPTLARAFDGRGNTFNNKHDYDRAIEDYNEAIRLNPDYAMTYSNRGAAYYFKGQYEQAIADYDEAIRRDPKNSRAFANRGSAFKKLGKTDRAIADESEAIRLDPGIPEHFDNRGLSHNRNADYDLAIADFSAAIRIRPEAKFLTNRGDAYQFKKEFDHAIADYNEALKLNPKFGLAYNNRGAAYEAKGDLERAIADLEQAIRLDPTNELAVKNLARAKLKRDRLTLVNPHQGPSFDCATAGHAAEKAICSDEELARFDREIDAAYQAALGRLDKKKADALRRDQKGFLATRNRLFGRPDYQLKTEMEKRLAQLRTIPPTR
jgi:tetratricopeptide (TPR) repeat protein